VEIRKEEGDLKRIEASTVEIGRDGKADPSIPFKLTLS